MKQKLKRTFVMLIAFAVLCTSVSVKAYAYENTQAQNQGASALSAAQGTDESKSNSTARTTTATNHFKLDAEKSANVDLYVATGTGDEKLKLISEGDEFVTTDTAVYFFVRVKDGYITETTFRHTFTFGSSGTTDYKAWPANESDIQTSVYHTIDDTTYTVPRQQDAKELGCTYKFQYTGLTGSCAYFWAMYAICGTPVEVSVEYDAAGGTDAPVDNTVYYHANVTNKGNHVITVSKEKPKQTGKTFTGWLGSNGIIYQPGAEVDLSSNWDSVSKNGSTGTFTFTAVWDDQVSVSYNGNGATGVTGVTDKNLYDKGTKAIVLENSFLRYEYNFTGWNTEPDGSGDSYKAGDEIAMNESVVLYAQWSKKATIKLTANSENVLFDGASHRVSGYTVSDNIGSDGVDTVTYTSISGVSASSVSASEVGTYVSAFSGTAVVKDGNKDVTDKFIIEKVPGQLVINSLPLAGDGNDGDDGDGDDNSGNNGGNGNGDSTDTGDNGETGNGDSDNNGDIDNGAGEEDNGAGDSDNGTGNGDNGDGDGDNIENNVGDDNGDSANTGNDGGNGNGDSANTGTDTGDNGGTGNNDSDNNGDIDNGAGEEDNGAGDYDNDSGNGDNGAGDSDNGTGNGDNGDGDGDNIENNVGDDNGDSANTGNDGGNGNGDSANTGTDTGNDGGTGNGESDNNGDIDNGAGEEDNGAGDSDNGTGNRNANAGNANAGNANAGNANAGNGNANAGNGDANAGNANADAGNANNTIADEGTPLGDGGMGGESADDTVIIEDEATPLSSGASWALINLLASIAAVVTSLLLLLAYQRGKKEDEDDYTKDDVDDEKWRSNTLRIGSIVPAITSVIIFCVTENMRNAMTLTDKWTLLMIVFFLVELLLAVLSGKKKEDEEERQNAQEA